MAIIPLKEHNITLTDLIKNSYLDEEANYDYTQYIVSPDFLIKDGKLIRINDVMHDKVMSYDNKPFPLFSCFSINDETKKIEFDGYIEGIQNFSFQVDNSRNTNFLDALGFTYADSFILLSTYPYCVNLENNRVYELDWDTSINKHTILPPDIKYIQQDFWKSNNKFVVKILKDGNSYLETYDSNWENSSVIDLPFTSRSTFFTKNYIYILNNGTLFEMPNYYTNTMY